MVDSWHKEEIFLHSKVFRLTLGPSQPPIPRVNGAPSPDIKWLRHEGEE